MNVTADDDGGSDGDHVGFFGEYLFGLASGGGTF